MTIKDHLSNDLKDAMRAQNKQKLAALRLITAAIKQIEVDERIVVDDSRLLAILDKMVKQRKESIHQFQSAARDDLVAQEQFELDIIQQYLPIPLTEAEISDLIAQAIAEVQAEKPSDIGKIMTYLKPLLQGRADMSKVSALVKDCL